LIIARTFLVLCLSLAGAYPAGCAETDGNMIFLDNGEVRLGMDLDLGGAITWLSESGSDENVVNSHDWGRQIQMSFYSGPIPYEPEGTTVHPSWRFLGWNPIQSGDCYDHRSQVIAHENDGETLYVKCIPMQWPMKNVPGECTFEVWATLEGNTVSVRARLNNARSDTTQYAARGQELPAVYTNGAYYRLFTYTGDAPFTGGPLHRITKVWDTSLGTQVPGGPWDSWYATENWAALVREDGWGLGIWSPGSYRYTGGFAGEPGSGGPKDPPTGYFAPLRTELLDHDITYEYAYRLVLGSLEEIREQVYDWHEGLAPPRYDFDGGREGWHFRDAEDDGWRFDGPWEVRFTGSQPALLGPHTLWRAEDLPVVRVHAAFEGGAQATLRWGKLGSSGPEGQGQKSFPVIGDGETRTYTVDLRDAQDYDGFLTQLQIVPDGDTAAVRMAAIGPADE